MPVTEGKWDTKVSGLMAAFTSPDIRAWRHADRLTIRNVLRGVSPYSGSEKLAGAAHVVFNISSAHVPAFVEGKTDRAYRNRYDLAAARIGGPSRSTAAPADARELIDKTLASLIGKKNWKALYYGAVELNGAGIRYYGDVALILKRGPELDDTLVLDRNSFDLICAPLRATTHPDGHWCSASAAVQADLIAGKWGADLSDMAFCKLFSTARSEGRRITVGAISEGLLSDEDYLEVVRSASFDVADVAEARITAADAAIDGYVADGLRRGPHPDWSELLWRHRRRKADLALKEKGIRMHVVGSSGRVRS